MSTQPTSAPPPAGFNPLHWNCNEGGPGAHCFNRLRRPKLEAFADCFPGRINFGDVDGLVEINGRGLLLEWKSERIEPRPGQRIMYERLTRTELLTVFYVVGDVGTMAVEALMLWHGGRRVCGWVPTTLDELKRRMRLWATWAQTQRLPKGDTAMTTGNNGRLVRRDRGFLCLRTGNPTFEYEIHEEQIAGATPLSWWVAHLRDKNWFTPEHERQLIETIHGNTSNQTEATHEQG